MDLFTEYRLGDLALKNRLVMSAMTRNRALAGNVPGPLALTYYTQRATAGLIVTEGTQVSPQGVGYARTPGIHSEEQVRGWRAITDAVHAEGGAIFLQLWHVGRISHPAFHGGELPVGPSAIAAAGHSYTPSGPQPMVAPRALELSEIPGVVDQFRQGARLAKEAGFDGVELHGANGYLLDQFLRTGANHRTDAYGGSVANRARLALDVTEAVIDVWGADRVGYKVSPRSGYNDMHDVNPAETFSYLARELSARRIGYLFVSEAIERGAAGGGTAVQADGRITSLLRSAFKGALIVNDGYGRDSGAAAIASGAGDLVGYGASFLANPDLPRRFQESARLNAPDPATFYMGEEKGYVDYPFLDGVEAAAAVTA
jgi:N-ethylmaleimide reductase